MNRKFTFAQGEFYHVYNRGNDKRNIFLENNDYRRFILLLFFCNGFKRVEMREIMKELSQGVTLGEFLGERGETLVDIGAYCLMPNHFHILLHEKIDGGITLFLKKICTAYSMYFNKKYERTGKLFERAFLAQHADHDQYLKYLFSYIHLNPAKIIDPEWKDNMVSNQSKLKNFVENYEFSSYGNYLGKFENKEILNYEAFPDYFDDNIANEINGWLKYE